LSAFALEEINCIVALQAASLGENSRPEVDKSFQPRGRRARQ